VISSLYALGRRDQMRAIEPPGHTEAGRFAAELAGALAEGADDVRTVVRQLAAAYPSLFSDLDGRILLRALSF
jgi:hypothetical protein